jgi:DNA-binding transcriptional regulator YdaS (Cro superfamily)
MKTNNTLQSFLDSLSPEELMHLADRAGTSKAYLYQLATGRRRAGMNISARLKAADGRITDAMLRPDLYQPAA